MTRKDYMKACEKLQEIRKAIREETGAKSVGDLAQDPAALEAYKLAIKLEAALDKLVMPWE